MSPAALILPPIAAISSASCEPLRFAVPFTITACRKFVMPAVAGCSQRVPAFTKRLSATTGASGVSWTVTVNPVSKRSAWSVCEGAAERGGGAGRGRRGRSASLLPLRDEADAREVVVAEILARHRLDLRRGHLAQPLEIVELVVERPRGLTLTVIQ